MIEALRELFSEYGTIIDIVAKTNLKAKGQAFIVFDEVEGAQKAIDEVQGFELFGKEMQLAFAKTRSDATVKRQGTEEEFESHKRRRLAEKGILSFPRARNLVSGNLAKCEQTRKKPPSRQNPRNSSNAPELLPMQPLLPAPSNLPVVRVSSPPTQLARPSSQTSTCLLIRSSSYRICLMSMRLRL